jgi:hypothetical protein
MYQVKTDDYKIEEQEMAFLLNVRKQHANEILVSNPLFDRKHYNTKV